MNFKRHALAGYMIAALLWVSGFSLLKAQNCTNLTNVIPCSGLILGQEENGTLGTFGSTVEWLSLGKAPFALPSGDQPYGLRIQRGNSTSLFQIQEDGSIKGRLNTGIRFGDILPVKSLSFTPARLDMDYFFQDQTSIVPTVSVTNIMTLIPADSKLDANGTAFVCRPPNLCAGRVGIERTNPTYTLDVNGVIRGTSFIISSDRRFKQNINQIGDAQSVLRELEGSTYEFNSETQSEDMDLFEGLQSGFIAQDMEAVLPHLVATDEQGYKSVSYLGVIPYLVEAIKSMSEEDLQSVSANQTARIASLKSSLEDLKSRLETLKTAQQD